MIFFRLLLNNCVYCYNCLFLNRITSKHYNTVYCSHKLLILLECEQTSHIFIQYFFNSLSVSSSLSARSRSKRRNKSAEEDLLKDLLEDYDKDARGVGNSNHTVYVTITFLLLRIQGLVSIWFGVIVFIQ